MKTMAQIEYIKHLYENEGKSLREIAKIVDMSFRTYNSLPIRSTGDQRNCRIWSKKRILF